MCSEGRVGLAGCPAEFPQLSIPQHIPVLQVVCVLKHACPLEMCVLTWHHSVRQHSRGIISYRTHITDEIKYNVYMCSVTCTSTHPVTK